MTWGEEEGGYVDREPPAAPMWGGRVGKTMDATEPSKIRVKAILESFDRDSIRER